MNKIIFLDVDGVLNNLNWAKRMFDEEGVRVLKEDILERRALLLLQLLVEKTGAKIVVSSSWRKIPTSFKSLCDQLEQHGMRVFDTTPHVGGERGNDITAWFNRNPGEYRYVILDDDSDMGDHMEHLVQTSWYKRGLTRGHVDRAIEILNEGPICRFDGTQNTEVKER